MLPTEWTKLKDSKVAAVKFLPNKHDLRGDVLVSFTGGSVFRYRDVPQIRVEKLVHSRDPGTYFENFIRPYYQLEKENILVQK